MTRTRGKGEEHWLFVHGWLVSGQVFDPLCDALDLTGRTFVQMDLAGVGHSAGVPGISRWTRDVLAQIEVLPGKIRLLGHSMGGLICQQVASQLSERIASLHLINPVPACGFEVPGNLLPLFESSASDLVARRNVFVASCGSSVSKRTEDFLMRIAAQVSQEAIQVGLRDWQAGIPGLAVDEIRCPTQVIGSGERFLSDELLRREVAARIPNADFSSVGSASHYALVESAQRVASKIESFLPH